MPLIALTLSLFLNQTALPAVEASPPPSNMSRVRFVASPDQQPYTVSLVNTELSCTAPCVLDIPAGEARLLFQTGKKTFSKSLDLNVPEAGLQYDPGDSGYYRSGIWLLSLALPAGLTTWAGVFALGVLLFGLDSSDQSVYPDAKEDRRNLDIMALAVAPAAALAVFLPMAIVGAYRLYHYRPHINQIPSPSDTASATRAPDDFQFAIVPTRDGFSAGVGFRF